MSLSLIIILITAAVSVPAFSKPDLFYKLDFAPTQILANKEWYRFFTHAFLHADWWHLGVNMFVLWMFGDVTQYYFQAYLGNLGILYFILLYAGGIIFAVLPSFQRHKNNPSYHSVGASGAVSALVFSSVLFSPATELCLYGIPFLCFPGILWALIYLIYSYQKSKQENDRINHQAHFWGAIFGLAFTAISIPQSLPMFLNQLSRILPF